MTQFQPGSPDDVAWTAFVCSMLKLLFSKDDAYDKQEQAIVRAAAWAKSLMAERAKRLATPTPADDRPKWRCETCVYRRDSPAVGVWCFKHNFVHGIPDFGCPQWEGKEGA